PLVPVIRVRPYFNRRQVAKWSIQRTENTESSLTAFLDEEMVFTEEPVAFKLGLGIVSKTFRRIKMPPPPALMMGRSLLLPSRSVQAKISNAPFSISFL